MKINKMALSLMLLLFLASISVNAQGTQKVSSEQNVLKKHTIDIDFAKSIIESSTHDSNFVLLDVRRPEEYNQEHIKGAVNINFLSSEFKEKISHLDKNKTYLLYCRSGHRSSLALNVFLNLGFKKVYSVKGGIIQWKNKGFPTTSE